MRKVIKTYPEPRGWDGDVYILEGWVWQIAVSHPDNEGTRQTKHWRTPKGVWDSVRNAPESHEDDQETAVDPFRVW